MCIRDRYAVEAGRYHTAIDGVSVARDQGRKLSAAAMGVSCLLYTSDAADERSSVDLGGRRIIKKKQLT